MADELTFWVLQYKDGRYHADPDGIYVGYTTDALKAVRFETWRQANDFHDRLGFMNRIEMRIIHIYVAITVGSELVAPALTWEQVQELSKQWGE